MLRINRIDYSGLIEQRYEAVNYGMDGFSTFIINKPSQNYSRMVTITNSSDNKTLTVTLPYNVTPDKIYFSSSGGTAREEGINQYQIIQLGCIFPMAVKWWTEKYLGLVNGTSYFSNSSDIVRLVNTSSGEGTDYFISTKFFTEDEPDQTINGIVISWNSDLS